MELLNFFDEFEELDNKQLTSDKHESSDEKLATLLSKLELLSDNVIPTLDFDIDDEINNKNNS